MALTITRTILKSDIRDWLDQSGDTVAERRLERAIQAGLERVSWVRHWSFLRDTYPVNTKLPYSTGTVSVNIGSTAVTGSGTTFPSDIVGAFIEFSGQRQQYEITERGGDTSLTIRSAYGNADATNLSGATYKIMYPAMDLPANFRVARALVDVQRNDELPEVQSDDMERLHAYDSGVSSPQCWAVRAKRSDPNISQLWLYPAPDTQELYQMLYIRTAGWYNSATPATATFALEPPAGGSGDAYYVDWPQNLKGLLLSSCKLALVEEGATKNIMPQVAYSDYDRKLSQAMADDEKVMQIKQLGRGSSISPRRRWRLTP